jgi:hypothetical protein
MIITGKSNVDTIETDIKASNRPKGRSFHLGIVVGPRSENQNLGFLSMDLVDVKSWDML